MTIITTPHSYGKHSCGVLSYNFLLYNQHSNNTDAPWHREKETFFTMTESRIIFINQSLFTFSEAFWDYAVVSCDSATVLFRDSLIQLTDRFTGYAFVHSSEIIRMTEPETVRDFSSGKSSVFCKAVYFIDKYAADVFTDRTT